MFKGFMSKLTAILVVLVLVLSLVACGSSTSTTPSSTTAPETTATTSADTATPAPKTPITLTFSTYNHWATAQANIMVPIDMYQKATGNKIDQQLYPDDQFMNVIKTKLAAGDAPDLIAVGASRVGNVPINQLESLEGSWISNMRPGMDYYCTKLEDKKWFVAPTGPCSFLGVIYNKEVFKKANVQLPLKTYNDFVAACEAIKEIGVSPLQIANKDGAGSNLGLVGGHFVYEQQPDLIKDIITNKVKPGDNPEIVMLFERILATKKYLKPDYASNTGLEALRQVIKGEAAMFFNGSWCYGIYNSAKEFADLKSNLPNIGLMPMTFGDDFKNEATVQFGPGAGFAIPISSKHKQDANDFINFVMTEDVFKAIAEKEPGTYPYNIDTPMNPWEIEMLGYIQSNNMLIRSQSLGTYSEEFDLGQQGWSDGIQGMFLGSSVKDALGTWYKKMSDVNKAARTPGW